MSSISNRPFVRGKGPLSYGERAVDHWESLSAARKRKVLLYLALRLVRLVRREVLTGFKELGEQVAIEASALAREACELARAFARLVRDIWVSLREPDVRRQVRESLAPCAAVVLLLFAAMTMLKPSPEEIEQRRAAFLEQVRIARANPPPPCVSDGDGGVWIDTGPSYVRPRDEGYARLRSRLCGY